MIIRGSNCASQDHRVVPVAGAGRGEVPADVDGRSRVSHHLRGTAEPRLHHLAVQGRLRQSREPGMVSRGRALLQAHLPLPVARDAAANVAEQTREKKTTVVQHTGHSSLEASARWRIIRTLRRGFHPTQRTQRNERNYIA